MNSSENTSTVGSANNKPIPDALNNLSRRLSDLQEEVEALIKDIEPALSPSRESETTPATAVPREPTSDVSHWLIDLADRMLKTTYLVNDARTRVEL